MDVNHKINRLKKSPIEPNKKRKIKGRNKKKDVDKSGQKLVHKTKKSKKEKVNLRNISQIKTKDTGTVNSASTMKETQVAQEDKIEFDFSKNLWEIFFLKKIKNEKDEEIEIYEGDIFKNNLRRIIINYKIKKLYNLLLIHIRHLKEKVLLVKEKTYFFERIEFYFKKFVEIEKYIFNCILLVKYFCILGDPISLIKAGETLNYIAKEFLDNNGLLVYSINLIIKKCVGLLKIRKYYRSIHIPYNIIKKYLLILSSLIKFSSLLNIPKLYHKFLDHYAEIFEIAFILLTNQHQPEKILLKSNLLFNVGCFFVKKNLIKSALKLYKEVIEIQEGLDINNLIYYISYYNCSILYYVIGDMKNTELYLGNAFHKKNQFYSNIHKIFSNSKKYINNFKNLECKLLLFNAEFNMEKQNYLTAIENLKNVIKLIESFYKRKTQNITKKSDNKKCTKTLKIIENNNNNRKEQKITFIFLFEVEFYENPLDKMLFIEKLKENVNGLFNAILFLQKEKENNFNNNKTNKKFIKSSEQLDNNHELKRNNSVKYINENKIRVKETKSKSCTKKVEISNYDIFYKRNKKEIPNINNEKPKTKENYNSENNIEKNNKIHFISKKNANLILDYFKDEFVKKIKIINDGEEYNNYFRYFIILLSNLSLKQIEILNNTQKRDLPIESYYNLPIFFSSQFKNTLNPAQKNIFDKINFLSLIRCKVLENPNKNICLDNINYKIFKSIRISIILKLKNYNDISEKINKIINLESNKKFLDFDYQNNDEKSYEESYYSESNDSENINKKDKFKFKNEIDLDKFRKELINEIKKRFYLLYSKEEINNMLLFIKSKIFIVLMNGLELKDIKEIKNDKSLLIEMLNNEIKKIKKTINNDKK